MQAIGRQPQRAPDDASVHYERHRPEQTTLYRLVQQHAANFIAHTEASSGARLPRFIKNEFDAFLERSRRLVMHHDRSTRNASAWAWLAQAHVLLHRLAAVG